MSDEANFATGEEGGCGVVVNRPDVCMGYVSATLRRGYRGRERARQRDSDGTPELFGQRHEEHSRCSIRGDGDGVVLFAPHGALCPRMGSVFGALLHMYSL